MCIVINTDFVDSWRDAIMVGNSPSTSGSMKRGKKSPRRYLFLVNMILTLSRGTLIHQTIVQHCQIDATLSQHILIILQKFSESAL